MASRGFPPKMCSMCLRASANCGGIDSITVSPAAAAAPRNSNSSRHCSFDASDTHHSSSVPISVRMARRCTGTCPVFPSAFFSTVWIGGNG